MPVDRPQHFWQVLGCDGGSRLTITPTRSPLGAFYRSPLGVRGGNRFAWLNGNYYFSRWGFGIAANDKSIIFTGEGYFSNANVYRPYSSFLKSGTWGRIPIINNGNFQYLELDGKVISVVHGHAGFMAMYSNHYTVMGVASSVDGVNWTDLSIEVDHLDVLPTQVFYGNGIYAVLLGAMMIYDSEWSVVQTTGDALDSLSAFVFHKKTNMFEAESSGLSDACYSSDCIAWSAHSTEVAHGFVDADYDAATDKSLAVSIAARSFDVGGYISDDAISWTQIDNGEAYHFCFSGGGRLFFGRPNYSNESIWAPGDYGARLIMSDDGGATWQDVTGENDPANNKYFNPCNGIYFQGKYYLVGRFGTDHGNYGTRVMVSSDGADWEPINGIIDRV